MGGETRYCEMDFSELTKIIFNKIQKVEPENVVKIMGCIFLKEPSEKEMLQLAFSPDNALLSKISDAKAILGISPKTANQIQFTLDFPDQFNSFPAGSRSFSSPANFHAPGPFWERQLASDHHAPMHSVEFAPRSYADTVEEDYSFRNPAQYLGLNGQVDPASPMNNYYYQDVALSGSNPLRATRRTPSLPEFPIKACHYFSRGYCKHGANCRYFHGQPGPDVYSQVLSPNYTDSANDDPSFSPGSLKKLEMEIAELLRTRSGPPVTIAALPMIYYDKYGKNLQAEGYLTESQRHGKAGYSLTKLLARLKNTIRVIDRPHGQHAVILAEDAPRYMDCRNERNDPGAIVASSHQIYLTFPAESTFTEEDVSNYFKQFGPVRDVRIPCQDKRMFGFVSFLYPETVNMILTKRNPHYICGARVLVKPYREKSRTIDRPCMEKIKSSMYYPSHYLDMDSELHAMPRESDSSRLLRKHLIEEQEKMVELERKRISEFNLVPKPYTQRPYFSYGVEELKAEVPGYFPLDHFSYTLDVLTNGSGSSNEKARNTSSYCEQDSSHIELPESPFASPPIGSSISTVT